MIAALTALTAFTVVIAVNAITCSPYTPLFFIEGVKAVVCVYKRIKGAM